MRIRITAVIILTSICLCLVGCSSLFGPWQHGPKYVFQVDPKLGDKWPGSPVDRAVILDKTKDILRKRAQRLLLTGEVSVTTEGEDKLVVEVPAGTSITQLKQLAPIGSLEFYYLNDVQSQVNPRGKWRMDNTGADMRDYTFTGLKGQTLSSENLSDIPKVLTQVVGAPKIKPVLTGADLLQNAKSAITPTSGRPIIEIEFNSRGAQVFSGFTAAHVKEILGIFYNGKLLTAPRINEKISGGKAIISGFKSLKEATEVANYINAGALPVHLKLLDSRKAPSTK